MFKTVKDYMKACSTYSKLDEQIKAFRSKLIGKGVKRSKTIRYDDGVIRVLPGEEIGQSNYYAKMWASLKEQIKTKGLRCHKASILNLIKNIESDPNNHGTRKKQPVIIAEFPPLKSRKNVRSRNRNRKRNSAR